MSAANTVKRHSSATMSASMPSTSAASSCASGGIGSSKADEFIKGAAIEVSKIYANPELTRKCANEAIQTIVTIQSSVQQKKVLAAMGSIVDRYCFTNNATNIKNDLKMMTEPMQSALSTEHKRMEYFKQMGTLPEGSYFKPQLVIFDIQSIIMNFLELPGVLATLKKEHKKKTSEDSFNSFLVAEVWREKVSHLSDGVLIVPLALYFAPIGIDSAKSLAAFLTFPSLPRYLLTNKENHFLVGLLGAKESSSINTFLLALSTSINILNGLKFVNQKGGHFYVVQFCLAFVHGNKDGMQKFSSLGGSMFQTNCMENKLIDFDCVNFELQRDVVPDFNNDWLLKICTWILDLVLLEMIPDTMDLPMANHRFQTFKILSPGKRALKTFDVQTMGVWLETLNEEEVLRLVTYLPFVFADYVPLKSESSWEVFIVLREIIFSLLGPMDKKHIPLLATKIETFLEKCKEYCPDSQLPDFFQVASQYPSAYAKFGPFDQFRAIKSAVDKNWQNLQKICLDLDGETLTEAFSWKQRMVMNERFLSKRGFSLDFNKDNRQSRKSPLSRDLLQQFELTSSYAVTGMNMVSYFCLEGEKFLPDSIIITGLSGEYLQFAKIVHILMNDVYDSCLCVCRKYKTVCFDKHYGSYKVVITKELEIVNLLQLEWKYPVRQMFSQDGSNFIVLNKAYQWID